MLKITAMESCFTGLKMTKSKQLSVGTKGRETKCRKRLSVKKTKCGN